MSRSGTNETRVGIGFVSVNISVGMLVFKMPQFQKNNLGEMSFKRALFHTRDETTTMFQNWMKSKELHFNR